jgi:hypothetical protein
MPWSMSTEIDAVVRSTSWSAKLELVIFRFILQLSQLEYRSH